MTQEPSLSVARLLGRSGPGICKATCAARDFLSAHDTPELLGRVGQTLREIPRAAHLDKRFVQKSYRGDLTQPPDDLLTGQGLFYITEQRKLFLDCTAGHYQMTWGYNHPELNRLVREALDLGVVWDDHSNIPGNPVKRLAARLVETACAPKVDPAALIDDPLALNTVLLGVCTGSVAASGALKMVLRHHEAVRPHTEPVLVALDGNYHGTDVLAQRLRGMWRRYFRRLKVVQVEPNDIGGLRKVFQTYRRRVAALLVEPILMNREAILLENEFLQTARKLCDQAGACLVLDEIQTGFWCPQVFMFRQYGIVPDMLVVGKGMTAGLHPLSAVVYRRRYDRLAQYDAISTNGNAPLASLIGLACLAMVQRDAARIDALERYYSRRLGEIPANHPRRVRELRGKGLLAGLKFHAVADALEFHRRCIQRGLWVRVHGYHEGHSTILTKLGLAADRPIVDFVVDSFHEILASLQRS